MLHRTDKGFVMKTKSYHLLHPLWILFNNLFLMFLFTDITFIIERIPSEKKVNNESTFYFKEIFRLENL
jgi:hypothetical protein